MTRALDETALRDFSPPPALLHVLRTLRARGREAWVVGGAVRDLLLGRAPAEYDVATSALPQEVAAAFPRVVETGIAHGTVTVVEDGLGIEVTTYRAGRSYAEAGEGAFVGTIEEDLAMRDFTVNAMAFDPLDGRFLDPHGGLEDLRRRCLRAVGDPSARFREDPLRPMRGARFAARFGLRIDRATRRAMPETLEAFCGVAAERVGAELGKLLVSPHPRYGLEILRRSGHLALFLPELLEGLGLRQNRWHRYDVYHHVLRAVDAAPPDLVVRLAVLLHDVDKPRTAAPSAKAPGENTFFGHEVSGAKRARAICERLRFSKRIAAEVELLVREHQFVYTEEWTDAAVRRMLARVGDSFDRLIQVRRADVLGHGRHTDELLANLRALETRARAQLDRKPALTVRDLAIDGRDVMQELRIPPSPRVGEALLFLLDAVLEDPSRNERDVLLHLLRERFGSP